MIVFTINGFKQLTHHKTGGHFEARMMKENYRFSHVYIFLFLLHPHRAAALHEEMLE